MGTVWFFMFITAVVLLGIVIFAVSTFLEHRRVDAMTDDERKQYYEQKEAAARQEAIRNEERNKEFKLGKPNPEIVCPHCQKKGQVRTRKAIARGTVHGNRLLGQKLTTQKDVTRLTCENCGMVWDI